LTDSQRILIR